MLTKHLTSMFGDRRKGAETPRPADRPVLEPLEERMLLSLLGIGAEIDFPITPYDATGTVAYEAALQSFDSEATPLAIRFSPTSARPIQAPRDFQLHIRVDNTGALLGGVAGDDLRIEGQIDQDGNGTIDYDGVLLTGEILEFGYLDTGTTTDEYDFRFAPTGGDLLGLFAGKDIGVRMLSPNSSFEGFTADFSGKAQGVLGAIEPLVVATGSLGGRVYLDADNNGADDGEVGLEGVTLTLENAASSVSLTAVTGPDGTYLFEDVPAGTYTLTETQPEDLLDGDDVAGTFGGTVGNDVIGEIAVAGGVDGTGYDFGELEPSALSGMVYVDFNNDGEANFDESIIEGVTVTLTGVDDRGDAVNLTTQTDEDGDYVFTDLRPGTYTVTETQPAGYLDGLDQVGTEGGTLANDQVSDIPLGVGVAGMNYDFGERPETTGDVGCGQTATIGFWRNKNGQRLLKSLNGGADATQLGNWLATTYPNMYGAEAGDHNLAGMTNAQVASFYETVFQAKKCGKWWKRKYGPRTKLDAQVMAVAFATYVTNQSLGGDAGVQYGFAVTEYGLGTAVFNVGDAGAAFGVANNTEVSVMDLLLATNDQAVDGVLYNDVHALRAMANAVYTAINEAGDRGDCTDAEFDTWFCQRLASLLAEYLG